jgi:hypothetical protein
VRDEFLRHTAALMLYSPRAAASAGDGLRDADPLRCRMRRRIGRVRVRPVLSPVRAPQAAQSAVLGRGFERV